MFHSKAGGGGSNAHGLLVARNLHVFVHLFDPLVYLMPVPDEPNFYLREKFGLAQLCHLVERAIPRLGEVARVHAHLERVEPIFHGIECSDVQRFSSAITSKDQHLIDCSH